MNPEASPSWIPGVSVAPGPIILGGNQLGSRLSSDASFELLDAHVSLGGTLVDTALVYADWLPDVEPSCSERVLGRWLRARGMAETVVVATKGGHPALTSPGVPRLDPVSLRLDVCRSLENLGLDRLRMWWLHRDDPATPEAEILAAVEALRSDGLVTAWGVCNWRAPRLQALRDAAAAQGLPGPVAGSVDFALARPAPGSLAADLVTLDPALAGLHERAQLPLVAYSAQAKGWFDKVARGETGPLDAIYGHDAGVNAASVVTDIAAELGATPTEVGLAAVWLLPFPTSAVVGPRNLDQLTSCWRAAHLELDERHLARLDVLVREAVASPG